MQEDTTHLHRVKTNGINMHQIYNDRQATAMRLQTKSPLNRRGGNRKHTECSEGVETGKRDDKQRGTRKGRENAKGVQGIYIGDYYYGVYRGDYYLFNKVYIDFMVIRGTPSSKAYKCGLSCHHGDIKMS